MVTRKFNRGTFDTQAVIKKYVPDGSFASSTHPPHEVNYNRQIKQIYMNFADDLLNPRGRSVTYYNEHGQFDR